MAGVALACLGIPPAEFYKLSPAEFFEAMTEYNNREQARLELGHRDTWEVCRYLSYTIMCMTPELKKKPQSVQEVLKFTWDTVPAKQKPMTQEELERRVLGIHRYMTKLNNKKNGKKK